MIKIKLEDTLFESFAAEDSPTPNVSASKTFIAYNPVSGKQVTPTIPPNTQYMIQQWRGSSVENFSPIINLVLMPQRMAWMAGMMPVIFIQHDVDPGRTGPTLEDDLEQTLAVLDPSCRFAPRFCKSLQEIHESVGSTEIIPFLPSDGLANLRLFNDPDDHYFLLSKRGLALSGLPTPKAQLVDFAVPQTAWSSDTLNHEISQAVKAIHERRPPFVLKSNSAGGSKGTYLIHNSEEKVMVEKDIANILLAELPTLNLANAYLHPLSLIMTDLLPGDAIGFNFYVHADGTAQFSTSTSQNFSKTHMWQGSTVIYSAQARLASEYADLIQTTARYLHSHGYRGPVGIDVMTDRTGVQNIVDLNPRPTGSFVLGCLRPHFAGVLGMDAVCTLPFMEFSATRKTFEKAFEKELQIGQMVVLAWYSDLKALRCSTCLAVSSVDKDSLGRLCAAIQEWVDENQSLKGG